MKNPQSAGTFVVREHFLRLSSADRAILSAEGIEGPLDLIFYDWTKRIICQVHEQSEKISLLFAMTHKQNNIASPSTNIWVVIC